MLDRTIGFGWAIPVGPIDIVPGFAFNMHILDEMTVEGATTSVRPLNMMITLGVDYGL